MSRDPDGVSHHEMVHARACRGERLPVKWVRRGRELVVESHVPWGRKGKARAAVALMAGGLAGGGDGAGDIHAAEGLAREAGVDVAEIRRRAKRYL
ncbi:hypothetical protein [Actinomycetospora termitidis]|uniref:Uncharacterized protein n=1 Tax=Actinomycetospora termitidis TaxID=3053470 RepID=A0ABT7MFJ6_9PSEU|nr:hypothetical protein [Actinomycetospora sp. Odt1-22]MDL5159445.1 hypothetical protein [Actinomycetospora sp. Odt1-22]